MHAKDIMTTHLVTISPDASLKQAIRLMLQHRVSGLPVVDSTGQLVGMLSEGDLLRRAEIGTEKTRRRWIEFLRSPGSLAGEYVQTHGRRVEEIMTSPVVTVTEDAPLEAIVSLMEKHRIKRLPVMRGIELVGIITRANLLHALARVAVEAKPATASDWAIRKRILEELHKQPWGPGNPVNVIVRDGIVDLHGVIIDERDRLALCVAAENVAGVKEVREHLGLIEPISGFVLDPDGGPRRVTKGMDAA